VTGSIGRQSLEVASRLSTPIAAIAARRGSAELLALAGQHPDARVGVAAPTAAEQQRFTDALGGRVSFGG